MSEILKAGSHTYGHWRTLVQPPNRDARPCEERSDEAIHVAAAPRRGLLRFARNDGERARRGALQGRLTRYFRMAALLTLLTLAFAAPASARALKLVALGDSLTAGYGVAAGKAFPDQLEAALKAKGWDVAVVNAGVSGDTAEDGLARYDWAVPPDADALIVELGANDMLRGLEPRTTKATLATILDRAKAAHLPTLLAGMRAAPNLGADYDGAFDAIYPALAGKYGAVLYPFFLDGVAGDPKLNQPDGLHPTAAGVAAIVKRILPSVEDLLGRAKR